MDHLDAMILRDITWNPADPHHSARGLRRPWDIARALGMHGTTVKRRLADMRESGVLRGVHLQPAPPLVSRLGSEHVLTFPSATAKHHGLDALRSHPEVWAAYGVVGNEVFVMLATPEGEDPDAAAARVAAESGAVSARFHHIRDWSVPVERVSALDLRILAAFTDDALRSVSDAADEVGVTAKTVTARMRALAAAKAFRVHPLVDYTRMDGGMVVLLDLALAVGASEPAHVEIANRFPLAFCRSTRGAENGYVVLHARGAAELEEMLVRAQTIPGVRGVELRVLRDSHHEPARWREALLARAEELARAKGLYAPSWLARPSLAARPA